MGHTLELGLPGEPWQKDPDRDCVWVRRVPPVGYAEVAQHFSPRSRFCVEVYFDLPHVSDDIGYVSDGLRVGYRYDCKTLEEAQEWGERLMLLRLKQYYRKLSAAVRLLEDR